MDVTNISTVLREIYTTKLLDGGYKMTISKQQKELCDFIIANQPVSKRLFSTKYNNKRKLGLLDNLPNRLGCYEEENGDIGFLYPERLKEFEVV